LDDPRTGVHYLHVRVLLDLRDKVAGQVVALPVDGAYRRITVGKTHVKASLQTKDDATGKARFVLALAAFGSLPSWMISRGSAWRWSPTHPCQARGWCGNWTRSSPDEDTRAPSSATTS
jgi:hypothetical protein